MKNKIKLLTHKNYLNTIRKAEGTKIFQNIFVDVNGKEIDITDNGRASCALFVSSMLMMFGLIDKKSAPHATVDGTLKALQKAGWQKTQENSLKDGDIIVWVRQKREDGKMHSHIGFYLGDNRAISNIPSKKSPSIHHYTYNDRRKIDSCWRYPEF